MRIAMLTLLLGGLALNGSQAPHNLEISLGGGYALIVTKKQTLDVVTIKKPSVFSLDYVHHPLKLTVSKGTIDLNQTTLPPTTLGHGSLLGWDLTGRTLKVLDGTEEFPTADIELPPYQMVEPCVEEVANVNNLFFLPDLTKMSQQTTLDDDLEKKFDGRLRLVGGKLSVTKLAPGCFEFKKGKETTRTKRLAHGIDGLLYSHSFNRDWITLVVSEDEKEIGKVVIVPQASMVRLEINTRHPATSESHKPIKHFKYFYGLLGDSVDKKEIPTWLGIPFTPGEACPPGFYDVPQ